MAFDLKSTIQILPFGLGVGLICKVFTFSKMYALCVEEFSLADIRSIFFGTMMITSIVFLAAKFRSFLEKSKFDDAINEQLKTHPGRNLNRGAFKYLSITWKSYVTGPLFACFIVFAASVFVISDALYFLVYNFMMFAGVLLLYLMLLFPNRLFRKASNAAEASKDQTNENVYKDEHWTNHMLNWIGVFEPKAKSFLGFSGFALLIGLFLFPGVRQDFGGGAPKKVKINMVDSLDHRFISSEIIFLSPEHYGVMTNSPSTITVIKTSQIKSVEIDRLNSINNFDTRNLVSTIITAINVYNKYL